MKLIIIVALLAFASTASALDLPTFVNAVTNDLTSLLDVVQDLIQCVTSLLTAIVNQVVKVVQDLLTLDLAGIVEEVIQLIPSILSAVETDCAAIVDDIVNVVKEILGLVVSLLEGEGSLLANFLASLIEVLLGGASNGIAFAASNEVGSSFEAAASAVSTI